MQTLPKFPRNWSTNFKIFVEFLYGQRSYFPNMIHVVYPKGQQEEYKTTLHQLVQQVILTALMVSYHILFLFIIKSDKSGQEPTRAVEPPANVG